MARRVDTGWRDGLLAVRHESWGHTMPGPGLTLPMIEYDRGVPVAAISYIRRGADLPTGNDVASAYAALGSIYDAEGKHLPFFTVRYDPRNWAMKVFPHNPAAWTFMDGTGWRKVTEYQFADMLYTLRERWMPDLSPYGVTFESDPWIDTEPSPEPVREAYPNADISKRRREYEPVAQVRATWRNPCVDLDAIVVDGDQRLAVVVDYKGPGSKINLGSTNVKALASLYTRSHHHHQGRMPVPAYVAAYEPRQGAPWTVRVHCANQSARLHLCYVLGMNSTDEDQLARAVADTEWVDLSESQWRAVLDAAQQL
jgi:hypothetical protein